MHGDTRWVTLTYSDDNLPNPPNVRKDHVQKFLKRLRKNVNPFRYFIVGEYGTKTWRPHYHCCFFGLSEYSDMAIFKAWGHCDPAGFRSGEINKDTARYTAGYTTQKLTKRKDLKKYGLEKEFMLSSRKNGGIGYPAIVEIAKKWRSSRFYEERIIRELKHGKIDRPLGRYLTVKLSELLQIPEEQFEAEYWLHQEEIFEKHLKNDSLDYYENLITEEETKAISKEKRYKMFNKKDGI